MKELEKILKIKGKRFLFKVETSPTPRDYMKYEELRNKIWREPKDHMSGTRNMKCENFFQDGSSLFIGVYVEDEEGNFREDNNQIIGFSYGFVGVKNKEISFRSIDNLLFYSQYTGIREDFQRFGLGVLIKKFQKEKVMEIFGIYTITCTYDPLSGINAYRNVHHFGMDIVKYREGYSGEFGGLLNRVDVPCDRFVVLWDLKKEKQRPEYDLEFLIESGQIAIQSDIVEVKGHKGSIKLEVVKKINLDLEHEFLLVEIPYDFYLMLRETDVPGGRARNVPLEWRMKTRQVFQTLFERNYKVIDFRCIQKNGRKRDFYILKR